MIWWLLLPSCPTCPHLTCSGLRISTFQNDQKHLCPRLTTFGLVPALTRWLWGKKGGEFISSGQPTVFILSSQFSAPHWHVQSCASRELCKGWHSCKQHQDHQVIQLFEVRARHIPGSSTSINHSIVAHDIRTRSDRDSAGF